MGAVGCGAKFYALPVVGPRAAEVVFRAKFHSPFLPVVGLSRTKLFLLIRSRFQEAVGTRVVGNHSNLSSVPNNPFHEIHESSGGFI
jgi:hypothetical protein